MLVPVQVKPVARGLSSSSAGVRPDICATGSYDNGKVCVKLPIVGSICFRTGGPSLSASVECCLGGTPWSPKVCCSIPGIGKACKSF
jgi:hypothetical protein